MEYAPEQRSQVCADREKDRETLFRTMDKPCPQRIERPLQFEDKTLLHPLTKEDLWQKSV